jgi:hypothetical protein
MQTSRPSQHQPGPGAQPARNQIAVQQVTRDRGPLQPQRPVVAHPLTHRGRTDLRMGKRGPIPLPLQIQQHAQLLIVKAVARVQHSQVEETRNIAQTIAQLTRHDLAIPTHPTRQVLDRMLLLAVLVEQLLLTDREAQPPTPIDRGALPLTPIDRGALPPIPIDREAQPLTPIDRGALPPIPIGRELRHNNARQDNPVAAEHLASSGLPTAVATALAHQGMVLHAHRATVLEHTDHLIAALPQ